MWPARTFPVNYSCSNGASGTLNLIDGATGAVGNLPIGTTCSLSEGTQPPTKDASYAWGTPTWTPSSSVTIVKNDASNVVGVVLNNPIHRVLGGFTVTKHVTGETGGYVAGTQFTVSYSCSDGSSGTLSLIDGQTATVNGLPLLTTCTLAETNKPSTKDASYVWGSETWTPSSSLTIVANNSNNTVGLVLTNPLVRVEGGFTVTKHVTGETGGYVAGSTFPVDYSCSNGASGTLHLTDGATERRHRAASAHHLHPVGGRQATHQGRQLRLGHRDVGSVQLVDHREERRLQRGGRGPEQPDHPGAGWLHRHQARDR